MLRISAAILLLSPAIASAQCLTADDINTGVTVEYANGNVSRISRTETGALLDAMINNSGYYSSTIFFESQSSVFQTARVSHRKGDWEARGKVAISYDFTAADISAFTAGDQGSGLHTSEYISGYGSGDSQFGWSVYESETLEVADCSYEAVRVFTTEFSVARVDLYVREILYLNELGFGITLGDSYYGLPANNNIIASLTAD